MTKAHFPSKQEIISSKKIMMTLGLRVLLLSMICIVLPLATSLLVIWKQTRLEKNREILGQLYHLGDAQKKMADLIFSESFLQLRSAKLFVDQTSDKELLRRDFQSILTGYPEKRLAIVTMSETKDKFLIQLSSQAIFDGKKIPYEEPMSIPLQPFFFYFCNCEDERIVVIGADINETQKLVLVFPAMNLVKISLSISEWAGAMGVAVVKKNKVLIQKQSLCSDSSCLIIPDVEVTRILNDEVDVPKIHNKARLAEILPLDMIPLSIRVDIAPILFDTRADQVMQYLMLILTITIIAGTIVTCILTFFMVRPFKYLAELMRLAGSGDFSVRYHQQYLGFEINALGRQFNQMLEMMTLAFDKAKKIHAEKEKLLHECALGHSIQHGIFPHLLPRLPQLEIAASFSPAADVAGDYYDLFLHESRTSKRLLITIGDASGKGMAASLYAFLLRSMLRSFTAAGQSLEQIIEHANQLFCLDTEEGGMFVTAWVGILNLEDNRLQYASLGHYPAMWKEAGGQVKELEGKGSAFGMSFVEPLTIQTVQLHPRDLLFLYTDGWIETKQLGISANRQHLLEWLKEQPEDATSKKIIASLETTMLAETTASDDRTALVIRLL